jgi:hypothetical protein
VDTIKAAEVISMFNRMLAFLLVTLVVFSATANAQSTGGSDTRDKDRAEIRANIESIFQAFIDWDVDKIYATHSEDWHGFLQRSRVPIKGIDEYMKANGIDWPKSDKDSKPTPNPSVGYRVEDFDLVFEGPDVAVASFIGEFVRTSTEAEITLNRMHIMDVYARRSGHWIQVASHTVMDPAWREERMSLPASVSQEEREQILTARATVWKAYFSNDRATLEKVIPVDTITIEEGSDAWGGRASILAGAQSFADSGGKLISLEFPKTEMQVYGNTIILYTTYRYEIEVKGERVTRAGRGTEIFVRRDGVLVNVGWHLDGEK